MMRFPFARKLGALMAGLACLGCVAIVAPAGAADNGQYPSDPAARTFTGGTAGWTSSSSFDSACAPPLLCPSVNNAYVPAGDAEGNGYITSEYTGVAGVGAVAGTTTAIWESPTFTYREAGTAPEDASFSMARRADVGQLLAVSGNAAEYSVALRDMSEGTRTLTVIAPRTLAGADAWTAVSKVTLEAGRLNSGDRYRIRIESLYRTGTSVVASGSADYDDVVLRTAASEGTGGNGNGARKTLRSRRLLSLFRSGLSKTAILAGHGGARGMRLVVRVSCPKAIGSACRVTAQGLLRRHRSATARRAVRVGSGKRRLVLLRVKPKLRAKLLKRRRLLVSEKVRAGGTSATAYRVRRLIRR